MRLSTAVLRPALGVFIIAHGLAHAVLPLRGWIDPATLTQNFMPFILYTVAVAGFTSAGLGILGVRPFTAMVRPALVLASAYSLVAIWCAGQGDVWWGASVDPGLLLVGATGAYRHLPAGSGQRGRVQKAISAVAVALVIYAASAVVLWPLHRSWGSAPAEHALALPGDRPDRNPSLELQRAVTVNAAPEQVWPWLLQLGQDRAGTQDDSVRAVEPGRALVLQNREAFVLEPIAEGKTRLIVRATVGDPAISSWAAAFDMMAFELPHFIKERRMMLRIKSLAESSMAKAS